MVATSANALRHAPADFLSPLARKRLFAVGETTEKAARQAGFSEIATAAGTAVDLAALIAGALPAGARVLHLAGRDRTAGFEEELTRLGYAVEIVETYRAEEISHEAGFISARLLAAPLWGAVVFSERGGRLLAALAARPEFNEQFEGTRFFCISAKVAAALGGRPALVAAEPTEDGVLALLSSQG